jgi:hypothetical protein
LLGRSKGYAGYGAFLLAGALAPTVNKYGSVPVHVQRFPFAVGAAAERELAAGWRAGVDLGAALALLRIRGEGLDVVDPAWRLDVGARVAVNVVSRPIWRGWAAVLAVHAEYFPRPYALDVDPLGTIGSLSRFWLGASAGLSYRTRQLR